MTTISAFEAQAEYFANIPILDRKYQASVHLEAESDEVFWDIMLQAYHPGTYFYISQSKDDSGEYDVRGCEQCLKYRNYLSKNFFICIDSDLRYLQKEKDIDCKHFILQTYCYSWENHYCFIDKIQDSWEKRCPEIAPDFNFSYFLKSLSLAVYEKLLHLLIMHKRGLKECSIIQLFPKQCVSPR